MQLLPTPTNSLGGSRGTPSYETGRRRIEDEGRRGLDDAVAALDGDTLIDAVDRAQDPVTWGRYAAAIARHERVFGRPAPHPTDDKGRLSAPFVEWMMGLPTGWVTDVLDRRPALGRLGNGVVTRQAVVAVVDLLEQQQRRTLAAAS